MKKSLLVAALATSLLVACQSANDSKPAAVVDQAEIQAETSRLNAWFDVKYEEQLQSSPLMMTFLGRKDKYDQFNDFSYQQADKDLAWRKASVEEMEASFDYDKLSADGKISYDLWKYTYQRDLEASKYRSHEYVFTQMNGTQAFLPSFMINFHKVDSKEDMVAYNARLSGIGKAINDLLAIAKDNAAGGVRPPKFAYEGVIEQSLNVITGAPFDKSNTVSPLRADAKAKVDALVKAEKITPEEANTLLEQNRTALLENIAPAYGELVTWFKEDIKNTDEIATGVGKQKGGVEYYNYRLKANTTTELTADQIHQIGLDEVARIKAEMIAIKDSVGFEGDLQAFFKFVKTDKQFFYPNTDEGRQAYITDTEAFLDEINQKLPDYFGILPKAPLVVKRVESFREVAGAPQHYFPGSPDGTRPGVYYAHLLDMNAMPKNEMEGVAYHEGNPGHHMQISIAQELTSVPKFRTQLGFTVYSEGWGLYAELLAKEMGQYKNPYSDFGRLVNEMWRAVRLVVDTGLHSKGWTEQDGIDYFTENTPISAGAIKQEVRRYIVWPGQATAYKIGMLKILELRANAKQALGDKFDIKGFHDVVLGGGAVSLDVLTLRVDQWVESVKAG
ncbi:DUF885 domain-containing protein [Thalassotalea agarivorans]|uniref:Uncharacterized conserved protein, DUF885 familyt n=1 Tax=Thalassotalea agarivorans TaxID=349064 RepID=A0A1H9ZNQ7_THASX|nr:DUF885 domain-containing protein [Thalassotalea agarivorans]SES83318.1 Uncharacterized conserved protein, DUF885 familyt [Thalassotalea agarivorans]